MGWKYLTKYRCPQCFETCDSPHEADLHCKEDVYDFIIYVCEVCGYKTTSVSDAASDCEYHK